MMFKVNLQLKYKMKFRAESLKFVFKTKY